ncbi:MAG TPA: hypothetical protein VHC86_16335 [Opitutaceae bacterium]|nr:hypothetical protein [Opitutaceae bacterium]
MPISTPASAANVPAPPARYAPNHPWDRNFHLAIIALAWLGILRGFGGDIVDHITQHRQAYPFIVHVHAAVFVAWLALFTVQIYLVRGRRLAAHRRLGFGLAWLAGLMAILGPATALTVQHLRLVNHWEVIPPVDLPQFISVQFTDIIAFVALTAAGILYRNEPAAHKRLMLLGTLYITDAGFARWLAPGWNALLGPGFWPFWVASYFGPAVLVALVGIYDLATRRRLHPAYVAGAAWVFGIQLLATALFFSPGWAVWARRIIAAWPW